MEVKIGVQNVAREIVLDSSDSSEDVTLAVSAALQAGGVLQLNDSKGRLVLVPVATLAYVEVGEPEVRRVGFGTM